MGPNAKVNVMDTGKISFPPAENLTSAVQLVAHRYTDRPIPAHQIFLPEIKIS
jgi:hypothetical protein